MLATSTLGSFSATPLPSETRIKLFLMLVNAGYFFPHSGRRETARPPTAGHEDAIVVPVGRRTAARMTVPSADIAAAGGGRTHGPGGFGEMWSPAPLLESR